MLPRRRGAWPGSRGCPTCFGLGSRLRRRCTLGCCRPGNRGGLLFLRGSLFSAGLLGGFFRCCLRLLGGLLGFLRRFLRRFLRGLFLRCQKLFALFSFLAFFILFAFSHHDPPLLPPTNFYRAFRAVRLEVRLFQSLLPQSRSTQSRPPQRRGQSISSILAGDRPSPNREAQLCAPRERLCLRQSAPCIRYCPQQSRPA